MSPSLVCYFKPILTVFKNDFDYYWLLSYCLYLITHSNTIKGKWGGGFSILHLPGNQLGRKLVDHPSLLDCEGKQQLKNRF